MPYLIGLMWRLLRLMCLMWSLMWSLLRSLLSGAFPIEWVVIFVALILCLVFYVGVTHFRGDFAVAMAYSRLTRLPLLFFGVSIACSAMRAALAHWGTLVVLALAWVVLWTNFRWAGKPVFRVAGQPVVHWHALAIVRVAVAVFTAVFTLECVALAPMLRFYYGSLLGFLARLAWNAYISLAFVTFATFAMESVTLESLREVPGVLVDGWRKTAVIDVDLDTLLGTLLDKLPSLDKGKLLLDKLLLIDVDFGTLLDRLLGRLLLCS